MSVYLTSAAPAPSTVILPNPELGDTDQLNIKSKFKMSMAGTVYSYINTPTMTKFLLSFSNVSTQSITALINVLSKGANKLFTYLDYNSVSHQVKVLNNPFERSADGRKACFDPVDFNECHSFTLELEVVP